MLHGTYPVSSIIRPATQPDAIRLQKAWSALRRNEGDWPKLVLGVAKALRAGRETFRNATTGEVDDKAFGQKWLHNFRRCEEWHLCLTAGTVVPANQERR